MSFDHEVIRLAKEMKELREIVSAHNQCLVEITLVLPEIVEALRKLEDQTTKLSSRIDNLCSVNNIRDGS